MREGTIVKRAINELIFMAAQALLVLPIAILNLRLYRYDLNVPLGYGGDSLVVLMYIKGLIQDGWPTVISQLSAPFFYPGAAFPLLTSVDWSLMKFLSLFTNEAGLIMNCFWLLTLVFSSWSASYASYQLGLSRVFAATVGVLYAFLPYALLRVEHLNLVYYLVPLICLLVFIVVSKGKYIRNPKQAAAIGLLGCLLQGFSYIYYSFFAVLLVGVAAVISFRKAAGCKQLILPLLAIVVVTTSTASNLIPAFTSIAANGKPPEMGYKIPLEAELYGAKIRRMILPHQDNAIRPLAQYAQKDIAASFPNENENMTARLGLFGAVGLLLIFLFSLQQLVGAREINEIAMLSALSIAIILVITVGGFGAAINVLTVPDIRAYNRFSVFLSFFTSCALSLYFQKLILEVDCLRRRILYGIFFGLAAFSLYDQLLDGQGLVAQQKENTARAIEERATVERLEAMLPGGASILQLPFTGYPLNLSSNKMNYYDHVRPYLWSRNLRWSWPSFSLRHRAWQTHIAEKRGIDLVHAAILSGFQAIWIDRAAYADNGAELITSLAQDRVVNIPLPSDRFVVLDLREEATVLRSSMTQSQFDRLAAEVLGPAIVFEWGKGFYEEEKSVEGFPFRWSKDLSRMTIHNLGDSKEKVCLRLKLLSPHPGSIKLSVGESEFNLSTSNHVRAFSLPIPMPAGHAEELSFQADMARLEAAGDPRSLYFYVMDYRIDKYTNTTQCSDNGREKACN